MVKVSKSGTDKLLKLVYESAVGESKKGTPSVTNYLYENSNVSGSTLDSLKANQWRQKPWTSAVEDVKQFKPMTSNVLKFPTPISLLTNTDFYSLYPVYRDRKYELPKHLDTTGIKFNVIKGRNPMNLLFRKCYYLVFPDSLQATVYYLETKNKSINGASLNLHFTSIRDELKYMSSPWLDSSVQNIPKEIHHNDTTKLFQMSPSKHHLLSMMLKEDKDPDYTTIQAFIDFDTRNASVLVKNLPFGLSKHALPRLLWDYDFPEHLDLEDCFTYLIQNPVHQLNFATIRFKDHDNAKRFVTTFHGKTWQNFQSEKVKRIYEPLLCEILN